MIESIIENKKGIALMIVSAILACVGQLFWKLFNIHQMSLYLIVGFILYGIGALVMIKAYKFGKLSVLQPIISLNYVISLILGVYILKEKINIYKVLGIIIIILGVLCIAGGDKNND